MSSLQKSGHRVLSLILLFCLAAFSGCSHSVASQNADEVETDSLLSGTAQPISKYVVAFDSYSYASSSQSDTTNILDSTGNIVNAIITDRNGNVALRDEEVQIRAYYPDYMAIVFDCDSVDGKQAYIRMNGQRCVMTLNKMMKVYTWDEFLRNLIIGVNPPLYESPNGRIMNCSDEDFEPGYNAIEMRGDWLHVETDTICGDFNSQYRKGWIKWRGADTLLIKLYFSC